MNRFQNGNQIRDQTTVPSFGNLSDMPQIVLVEELFE